MYKVSEEAKRKVYEKFGRNEKSVEEDVNIIKTWMKTQPHLPELMEDVKIKNFLNLNKYSIEKTKKKIDMYYTIRTLLPEIFANSNPKLEAMQSVLDKTYLATHPKCLDDTSRVWFAKQKGPNMFELADASKLLFCIFELRLNEDFICDDIWFVDLADFTLTDLQKFTISAIGNMATVYEKVYSFRLKNIHYLNSPPYISAVLAVLKTVFKPKLFDRIIAHRDAKIVQELFSKEDLPKDYGGLGPSLEELNELMKRKFSEYQHRFDILDNLKVDESLRPEKLNNDEVLGYYGNFKKIDFD